MSRVFWPPLYVSTLSMPRSGPVFFIWALKIKMLLVVCRWCEYIYTRVQCAYNVSVYGHVHMSVVLAEVRRVLSTLEFEFETCVFPTWVLGTQLWISGRAACALNAWVILFGAPFHLCEHTVSDTELIRPRKCGLPEGTMQASKGGEQPIVLPCYEAYKPQKDQHGTLTLRVYEWHT